MTQPTCETCEHECYDLLWDGRAECLDCGENFWPTARQITLREHQPAQPETPDHFADPGKKGER